MIHFNCQKCGKGFTVPDNFSGKKGKCSECKSVITIPFKTDKANPTAEKKVSSPANDNNSSFPPELQKPEFLNDRMDSAAYEKNKLAAETQRQEEKNDFVRKLPWFIDIFLYPANITGITMLIILVGIPFLISLLSLMFPPLSLAGAIINMIIGLYAYWYLCQCVRDSAKGYIRIPKGIGNYPDLRDMFSEMANIVGCLVLFFAPAYIYTYITKQKNEIFNSLLVFGIAFYPMGLLSIIMHDSAYGLNPFLLIVSIVKTIFQYIGLVLIFWSGIFAVHYLQFYVMEYLSGNAYGVSIRFVISMGLFRFIEIYLVIVAAHLLGRFYCKNSHKLNWEV